MHAFTVVVAALALVPQPRSVVETGGYTSNTAKTFRVDLTLPKEGYRLKVTDAGAEIAYADGAGRLYAQVTLDQMRRRDGKFAKAEISDWPLYPWRAWLVDVARHWLPKEHLFDVMDVMVLHKMNVLHWHLTEDQAWRLPIEGRPELVAYGATRAYNKSELGCRWKRVAKWLEEPQAQKYGPYAYTAQDVAEVLAYAKARHVKVIPEIDIPAHTKAMLCAYPDLGCRPDVLEKDRTPMPNYGNTDEVLCIGNEKTMEVVFDILDKVCRMFPDAEYIHIGGDECSTRRWKECPKCQAKMKAEGLKTERELLTWFGKKVSEFLAARGKKTMGWAEIVEDGTLDRKSTVPMAWLYPDPGLRGLGRFCPTFEELTDMGYDIVAGSHKHGYWGPRHSRDDEYEPVSPTAKDFFFISLEDAYDLDISCGPAKPGKGRVLGTEGYAWGEGCWNFFDYMYRSLPRTCAIAEVAWGAPEPKRYVDFYGRMVAHAKRLRAMKIPCAPVDPPGSMRLTPANCRQDGK